MHKSQFFLLGFWAWITLITNPEKFQAEKLNNQIKSPPK